MIVGRQDVDPQDLVLSEPCEGVIVDGYITILPSRVEEASLDGHRSAARDGEQAGGDESHKGDAVLDRRHARVLPERARPWLPA